MRERNRMDGRKRAAYRRFLSAAALAAMLALGASVCGAWWRQVPGQIRIRKSAVQSVAFSVPARGEIYPVREETAEADARPAMAESREVFLDRPVTFVTGQEPGLYRMNLRLFGVLPFKEVAIQVVEEESVIPAGFPVGIYVETQGVLVLGTGTFTGAQGQSLSPAAGVLRPGDYILAADGEAVTGREDFMRRVEQSGGQDMELELLRGAERFPVRLRPEQAQNGSYKLGVWIRDDAQGVGTLTYLRDDGSFGALGHGINDLDTNTLMNVAGGGLYETEIVGIRRGENGVPGELTGVIDYNSQYELGTIERNTEKGIFGTANGTLRGAAAAAPVPVGFKQEVHTGEAQMLCAVNGAPQYYQIQIEEVHPQKEDVNRGMVVRVTDERLLELTGGIVQGMSGSPILQDGRMVGAVTHVFVNDPTRGYGIFLETMLE